MKHCIECGCILPDDHDGEICEVCFEERDGTVADSCREDGEDEECLYPKLLIDTARINKPNYDRIFSNRFLR